jgi:sec-independent protein translocase protein TatA
MIFDSPMDVGLVVLIALILFGGKRIPELMRDLGKGIRNFRNGGGASPQGPGSPQHPIPVTGPIETKHNSQSKKDDDSF